MQFGVDLFTRVFVYGIAGGALVMTLSYTVIVGIKLMYKLFK